MRKHCVLDSLAGDFLLAGARPGQGRVTDAAAIADRAPARQAPTATPAPAPRPKSVFTQGGIDLNFMFDGYGNGSYNHPDSGFNGLRNFDLPADTEHVNMGMVTIDRAPAPVGFHLDVGFGETFDVIHSTDRAPEAFKYFKQAYVSFKPKFWHGVEIDAGEFVTSAGAVVIETNLNRKYSRSPLVAWAIPYYHFGVRASIPIGKFTGGGRWCRTGITSNIFVYDVEEAIRIRNGDRGSAAL